MLKRHHEDSLLPVRQSAPASRSLTGNSWPARELTSFRGRVISEAEMHFCDFLKCSEATDQQSAGAPEVRYRFLVQPLPLVMCLQELLAVQEQKPKEGRWASLWMAGHW